MSARESKAHARRGRKHAPHLRVMATAPTSERAWDRRNPRRRGPGYGMPLKVDLSIQIFCPYCPAMIGKPEWLREETAPPDGNVPIASLAWRLECAKKIDKLPLWWLIKLGQQHETERAGHRCYAVWVPAHRPLSRAEVYYDALRVRLTPPY